MYTELVVSVHSHPDDASAPPWIDSLALRFDTFDQAQACLHAFQQFALSLGHTITEPSLELAPLPFDAQPIETTTDEWATFASYFDPQEGEEESIDPNTCAEWLDQVGDDPTVCTDWYNQETLTPEDLDLFARWKGQGLLH